MNRDAEQFERQAHTLAGDLLEFFEQRNPSVAVCLAAVAIVQVECLRRLAEKNGLDSIVEQYEATASEVVSRLREHGPAQRVTRH